MSNPFSGLGSPLKPEYLCVFSHTIHRWAAKLACLPPTLSSGPFQDWVALGLEDHPTYLLQVVPVWSFCSSQTPCLSRSWGGWRCHGSENTDHTNPSFSPWRRRMHQGSLKKAFLGAGGGSDIHMGNPAGPAPEPVPPPRVLPQATLVKHGVC